jgi:hypothetical protein
MPDFFDDLMPTTVKPAISSGLPATAPVSQGTGDFFDSLMPAASAPSAQPQATSPAAPTEQPDDNSFWAQHGQLIEGAAGAGLALLLGPKAVSLGKAALKATGPVGEAVGAGLRNVQTIAAPSTISEDAGRAAGTIRAESGLAARDIAQTKASLEPFWQSIGLAPEAEKRSFINYVETRSKGGVLDNPELQPLADEMRAQYAKVHEDLGEISKSQKAGFIQDYYRHQWVQDATHERVFSKEGGRSFTKERTIPTIEEGMAKGLTPKTLDPVQTTLEYVDNARRFLASNKVLQEGQKNGDVIFRSLGAKTKFPDGDNWVPIEGSLGRKGGGQLFAREGWARVYNNWRSPGFTGAAGDVVQGLRRTSNTITGMELGLSGFHFTTMLNEAVINDVANAVTNLSKGRYGEAAKGIALSPTAPYRLYKHGRNLEGVYLGKDQGSQEMREMADLLTAAGGRAKGSAHAKDYEYTAMGSFFDAWKKGSLGTEGQQYLNNMAAAPITGTAKTIGSLISRTMQTVTQPLFQVYIPRLKNGAFYDTMGQWIKANPGADSAAKQAAARQIWDSIDNRFGEAVNDNIFWKQHMKQIAMLAMRSYSWNVGTVREIGGGLTDAASHKMTPRVAYTIALPVVYGTLGALYQKMKTGEGPQDEQDLIAPRTGGTDPATGQPERMIMPGYMKDVFGWASDPLELAKHKLSTFITTAGELATGKDWRGAPIAPPGDPDAPFEQNAPAWLNAYMKHVASKFVPISVHDYMRGQKVGTNITVGERMLGIQPGGRKFVDPEGLEAYNRYRKLKEWRSKESFDARQESYYGGTD